MSERTESGVRLRATQRSNRDESVLVRDLMIRPDREGLKIAGEVGHGRGFALEVTVTLEEIAAWKSDLLARRSEQTDMAVRAAEQRMRALAATEGKPSGSIFLTSKAIRLMLRSYDRGREGKNVDGDLRELDEALTAIVGAVLEESNRTASTIIGIAASKLMAAGVMAGAFGAIGAFGVASTGTAIATLSGAAAATATLYWIGSSIGMGVAAGSLMLTGGALAAGIPAAIAVRRRILGRRRTERDLDAREQAALYAALRLAAPVRVARARQAPLSRVEMRLFAREGLDPLTAALDGLYTTDLGNDGGATCAARSGSLAYWPRRRLRRACARLARIAARWSEA